LEEAVLIGFGGGQCCDAAKYAAWYLEHIEQRIPSEGSGKLPFERVLCIEVPSVVSVDAFLCEAVAVREGGKVRYLAGRRPDAVYVDYGIVCEAPKHLNRSGVADCLSIYTALFDWKLSAERTGERYDCGVAAQSRAIIDDLLAVEEKIRRVTPEGVRAIVEGYVHEIDLCTGWGNSRPEEGSEHFFAYNYEYLCTAENRREHILHGELVGLGLFVQAAAQGEYAAEPGRGAKPERATEIVETMDALGLNWAPEAVDPEMISKAMKTLRSYCEGESLPFSVANVFEYPDEFCERVLEEIEKQQARRTGRTD
jgi:glycerol-1-phosphate dehydrogenase [NAD(P)+]